MEINLRDPTTFQTLAGGMINQLVINVDTGDAVIKEVDKPDKAEGCYFENEWFVVDLQRMLFKRDIELIAKKILPLVDGKLFDELEIAMDHLYMGKYD